MAMTLEDTERLFGRSHGLNPLRRRDPKAQAWLAERNRRPLPGLWRAVTAGAVVGFVMGVALLWVSETNDHRLRAIVRRAERGEI